MFIPVRYMLYIASVVNEGWNRLNCLMIFWLGNTIVSAKWISLSMNWLPVAGVLFRDSLIVWL